MVITDLDKDEFFVDRIDNFEIYFENGEIYKTNQIWTCDEYLNIETGKIKLKACFLSQKLFDMYHKRVGIIKIIIDMSVFSYKDILCSKLLDPKKYKYRIIYNCSNCYIKNLKNKYESDGEMKVTIEGEFYHE